MSALDTAKNLHHQGLEHSLDGRPAEALPLLTEAKEHYRSAEYPTGFYHTDRDLVRVYAGLGNRVLRDVSATAAIAGHRDVLASAGSNGDKTRAKSELAASLHVGARLCLAHTVEPPYEREPSIEQMVENWREAYGLISSSEDTNLDYRQQIVAHAGLAVAAFGNIRDLQFVNRLYGDHSLDTSKHKNIDPKRVAAIEAARKIMLARFVPFALRIKGVRSEVVEKVAGAYIVR